MSGADTEGGSLGRYNGGTIPTRSKQGGTLKPAAPVCGSEKGFNPDQYEKDLDRKISGR